MAAQRRRSPLIKSDCMKQVGCPNTGKVEPATACQLRRLSCRVLHLYVARALSVAAEHLTMCRYEVEKLTASQRLDLNLEKGRMRDELQVSSPCVICKLLSVRLCLLIVACRLAEQADRHRVLN